MLFNRLTYSLLYDSLLKMAAGNTTVGSILRRRNFLGFRLTPPITDALDLTTPSGRALAAMLAIFASFERDVLRDRVKAGIAHAKLLGKPHGRPSTTAKHVEQIRSLFAAGVSKREISKRLRISRASVIKWLKSKP